MTTLPRESKYRHIFNDIVTGDQNYLDIKPDLFGESQHIAVNSKYWAVPVYASGGGSFMVHPISKPGRIPLKHAVINYHTSHILDLAFSPFNDDIIATSSEDCSIKVLKIPEGMDGNIKEPSVVLEGHSKKVTVMDWHPTVQHLLATSGNDKRVMVWNAETGELESNIDDHEDLVYSIAWNKNGKYIASSCQDQIIRVLDPRDEMGGLISIEGHDSKKISKVFWMGNEHVLGSVGFNKQSYREALFYDIRSSKTPLLTFKFDRQNSKFFPYFEPGNNLLFLAGKGDQGIRAYEVPTTHDACYQITELKASEPHKGVAIMPRRHVDTSKGEILRVYRLMSNSIEPMSVCVPRRNAAMVFQEDLYPDCYSGKSVINIDQYFEGRIQTLHFAL